VPAGGGETVVVLAAGEGFAELFLDSFGGDGRGVVGVLVLAGFSFVVFSTVPVIPAFILTVHAFSFANLA